VEKTSFERLAKDATQAGRYLAALGGAAPEMQEVPRRRSDEAMLNQRPISALANPRQRQRVRMSIKELLEHLREHGRFMR
jgi:hypothetical protein